MRLSLAMMFFSEFYRVGCFRWMFLRRGRDVFLQQDEEGDGIIPKTQEAGSEAKRRRRIKLVVFSVCFVYKFLEHKTSFSFLL